MFSAYGHFPCIKQTIPKTARSKGLFEAEIKDKNLKVSISLEVFILGKPNHRDIFQFQTRAGGADIFLDCFMLLIQDYACTPSNLIFILFDFLIIV